VGLRADRTPPSSLSPVADLSNVIPFVRSRRTGTEPSTPPVTVGVADRPAAAPPGVSVTWQLAVLACSLAIHGALVFTFWEQPRPLPSIGIGTITVEIVGDNRAPGPAPTSGESPETIDEVKGVDKPAEQEQERTPEVSAVKSEEKRAEAAAEQPAEQADVQQPDTRQAIAMAESPQAETPTALPRETPPDMQAVIAPPRDEPKEVKPVEPKAKQPEQKKAAQKKTEQKKTERKQAVRPTVAAGGAGIHSVASDPNYKVRVFAHLGRHQQYPASARNSGIQGKGVVKFWIDSRGSVTSISIISSTGAAVLDQEMVAMVRRASPVPAPPNGRSQFFTAPVNWRLK
jgi:protein TonB